MDSIKQIQTATLNMFVSFIDYETCTLYAECRQNVNGEYFNEEISISLYALEKMLNGEDYREMTNMHGPNSHTVRVLPNLMMGRLFKLHIEYDQNEYITGRYIEVPTTKPFTKEEIEQAEKYAEDLSEILKGE